MKQTSITRKILMERLGVDAATAAKLRSILNGDLDYLMTFESVSKWVRQCYNMPRNRELVMCALNEVLGTHGTEAVRGEWQNGYWCDVKFVYLNAGDTYAATVIYDRDHGWQLTTYGDWIEYLERRGENVQ